MRRWTFIKVLKQLTLRVNTVHCVSLNNTVNISHPMQVKNKRCEGVMTPVLFLGQLARLQRAGTVRFMCVGEPTCDRTV
jgi:hypothetical protein